MKKFLIDHIDPLGQGVFKDDDQIYFIPKTLPRESGTFKILKKKKGVHFCQLVDLDQPSHQRQNAPCPHFDSCNGCHFQHISLEDEREYKLKTYQRLLTQITNQNIEIKNLLGDERFGYRNRIQLHYDVKNELIGFHQAHSQKIVPIENCLIANSSIQKSLSSFLGSKTWIKEAKKSGRSIGHVEIAEIDGKVSYHWNEAYASVGFTQVNASVNEKLQTEIAHLLSGKSKKILDLFGGNGNLVKKINNVETLSVDINIHGNSGFEIDLFKSDSLEKFKNLAPTHFDTLLLDPPRAGFNGLKAWTDEIQPQTILYVSCHPQTMIRDLKHISEHYTPEIFYFIDFFPATYHYEAAILLNRRVN